MQKLPTVTHQQKSVAVVKSKPVFFEKDDLKKARCLFMELLSEHRPLEKFKGPIRLTTWWCYKVSAKHYNGEYKTSKPDTDNIIKLLKDVMTSLNFWTDDAEIVIDVIAKYWADVPGVFIKIEGLEQPPKPSKKE